MSLSIKSKRFSVWAGRNFGPAGQADCGEGAANLNLDREDKKKQVFLCVLIFLNFCTMAEICSSFS